MNDYFISCDCKQPATCRSCRGPYFYYYWSRFCYCPSTAMQLGFREQLPKPAVTRYTRNEFFISSSLQVDRTMVYSVSQSSFSNVERNFILHRLEHVLKASVESRETYKYLILVCVHSLHVLSAILWLTMRITSTVYYHIEN